MEEIPWTATAAAVEAGSGKGKAEDLCARRRALSLRSHRFSGSGRDPAFSQHAVHASEQIVLDQAHSEDSSADFASVSDGHLRRRAGAGEYGSDPHLDSVLSKPRKPKPKELP